MIKIELIQKIINSANNFLIRRYKHKNMSGKVEGSGSVWNVNSWHW